MFLTFVTGQFGCGSNDPYQLDHNWFVSLNLGQRSVNSHDWKYSQFTPSGLQRWNITTSFKNIYTHVGMKNYIIVYKYLTYKL